MPYQLCDGVRFVDNHKMTAIFYGKVRPFKWYDLIGCTVNLRGII
jgi:hypothetical protein